MLYNVQILRAIAALMVVHGHAGAGGLGLRYPIGGLNGVDLFFVISGFIIAYVADADSHQFMMRRLIRIVPIYWVSTLTIFFLALAVPQYFRITSTDLPLLIRSLLFLPDPSAINPYRTDGLPHPTLAGGWTLNYEMYFYVTFAIALAFSRARATAIAAVALLAIILVVNATSLDDSPVAHFYGYPIVLEFMYGMLAFHVVRHAERAGWRDRAPRLQRAILLVVATVALGLLLTRVVSSSAPRWFSNGIPAFFLVTAAVLLERLHGFKITNSLGVLIGNASYVLYLSHAYVVLGIIRLFIGKRHFSELLGQTIVFGLMVLSCLVAIAIHLYVEKPLLDVLKGPLLRVRARPSA